MAIIGGIPYFQTNPFGGSLRSPNSRSAEAATKLQPASNGTHVASQFGWCWCLPKPPSESQNRENAEQSRSVGLAWHRFSSEVSESTTLPKRQKSRGDPEVPKARAKDTETPTSFCGQISGPTRQKARERSSEID